MTLVLPITPPDICCPNRYSTERALVALVKEKLRDKSANLKLLDLGCGPGEFRFLVPHSLYLGVDQTDFDFAQKQTSRHRFVVCSVESLELNEDFNFIFSHYAFHYFPNTNRVLANCYDHLAPGGHLIFSLPRSVVRIYEWPNLVLRPFNHRVWVSSSGVTHQYYSNRIINQLYAIGYKDVEIHIGAGPVMGLLKFLYILFAAFRGALGCLKIFLSSIFVNRTVSFTEVREFLKHFSFLPRRSIGLVTSYEEFLTHWCKFNANRSLFSILYEGILIIGYEIDRYLPRCLAFELIVSARKQRVSDSRMHSRGS